MELIIILLLLQEIINSFNIFLFLLHSSTVKHEIFVRYGLFNGGIVLYLFPDTKIYIIFKKTKLFQRKFQKIFY